MYNTYKKKQKKKTKIKPKKKKIIWKIIWKKQERKTFELRKKGIQIGEKYKQTSQDNKNMKKKIKAKKRQNVSREKQE